MHDQGDDRPDDGLDDHPDLADVRWSKRDERKAAKRARGPRARPGAGFLHRHRATVLSIAGLVVLVVAGVVLVGGADRGGAGTVDLERPFFGTPVDRWAEGAAGIMAPAPAAVGAYPAEKVAAAYTAVRQLLTTARLDRSVIVKHDVEPYLRQLAPAAQLEIRGSIAKEPTAGYGYVTRISDDFRLLPVQPRVSGWMEATLGKDGGLLVQTDVVVAYAFDTDEPDRLIDQMEIIAVGRLSGDVLVTDESWPASDRGLWPLPVKGYAYSMACTPYDSGTLAPAYSERIATDADNPEERARMFDPELPMPTGSGCPD